MDRYKYDVYALAMFVELVAEKTGKNRRELGELFDFATMYKFLKHPEEDAPVKLPAHWFVIMHEELGLSIDLLYQRIFKIDRGVKRNFLSQRKLEIISNIRAQLNELEQKETIQEQIG